MEGEICKIWLLVLGDGKRKERVLMEKGYGVIIFSSNYKVFFGFLLWKWKVWFIFFFRNVGVIYGVFGWS